MNQTFLYDTQHPHIPAVKAAIEAIEKGERYIEYGWN